MDEGKHWQVQHLVGLHRSHVIGDFHNVLACSKANFKEKYLLMASNPNYCFLR